MPRTHFHERPSPSGPDAEREQLFQLTREAEAAERLSLELPSSVLRRVAMLESNMRLVDAYNSASGETQRVVESAVVERVRRRQNILRGHVDVQGHPFDVDTDEEADEEIRRELTREGYVYVANAAGERSYYHRIDDYHHNGNRQTLSERSLAHVIHPPPAATAAVVPQEEDREPVWYFRRAREIEGEDAVRAARTARSTEETRRLDAFEAEMRAMEDLIATTATLSNDRYDRSNNPWSAAYTRQSARVDLKALLHKTQQKLEEEIEAARGGRPFLEGSYLQLTDLLRDMFLCVERI